jgi:UDP-glucose 4-epimerase
MTASSTHPSLAGSTALVTGASGFIGTHLCRQLSAAGAFVHAVSRRPRATSVGVRGAGTGVEDRAGNEPRQHWHCADLRDVEAARTIVAEIKPDLVFHLAGLATGARELRAVRPTFEHNLATTLNILEAATDVGCRRVILAGSLEEPDPGEEGVAPSSPYAAAKWASSAYGRMFHALYATPVVIARIFMVYGPEQPDLKKVIPYTALALLRGESPRLTSGARPVDWIYVEDAAAGLMSLAVAPSIEGATIEIGSGTLVTVRIVVETVASLIPSRAAPIFGVQADRPMEQVRAAHVDETFLRIGWRPATALRDGLARTVEWCRYLVAMGNPRAPSV